MIKTIIFDLGNVIVPFDFKRGYTGMGQLIGMPPDEVRQRITDAGLVVPYETGHLDSAEFLDGVCGALGHNMDRDTFSRIWSSIFLPEPNFTPGFVNSLARTHRLLILSNTNDIHWNMIRTTYPVVGQFHDYVLSYKVKAMKPAPAIYQAAITLAQCKPEECFFTDDVQAYVEGARDHGIDAVQFQSASQIAAELRGRGVDC